MNSCAQDFLNMFFRDKYCPIPSVYNLVLAMLWRHPQNVDLDNVKVAHYCAAVSTYIIHDISVFHILAFFDKTYINPCIVCDNRQNN